MCNKKPKLPGCACSALSLVQQQNGDIFSKKGVFPQISIVL